jgi:hypothetical protein
MGILSGESGRQMDFDVLPLMVPHQRVGLPSR